MSSCFQVVVVFAIFCEFIAASQISTNKIVCGNDMDECRIHCNNSQSCSKTEIHSQATITSILCETNDSCDFSQIYCGDISNQNTEDIDKCTINFSPNIVVQNMTVYCNGDVDECVVNNTLNRFVLSKMECNNGNTYNNNNECILYCPFANSCLKSSLVCYSPANCLCFGDGCKEIKFIDVADYISTTMTSPTSQQTEGTNSIINTVQSKKDEMLSGDMEYLTIIVVVNGLLLISFCCGLLIGCIWMKYSRSKNNTKTSQPVQTTDMQNLQIQINHEQVNSGTRVSSTKSSKYIKSRSVLSSTLEKPIPSPTPTPTPMPMDIQDQYQIHRSSSIKGYTPRSSHNISGTGVQLQQTAISNTRLDPNFRPKSYFIDNGNCSSSPSSQPTMKNNINQKKAIKKQQIMIAQFNDSEQESDSEQQQTNKRPSKAIYTINTIQIRPFIENESQDFGSVISKIKSVDMGPILASTPLENIESSISKSCNNSHSNAFTPSSVMNSYKLKLQIHDKHDQSKGNDEADPLSIGTDPYNSEHFV